MVGGEGREWREWSVWRRCWGGGGSMGQGDEVM